MSAASRSISRALDTVIVAVPETAGSALYGMLDVLNAAGNLWQTLMRDDGGRRPFHVRIASPTSRRFVCGNGIPVVPDCAIGGDLTPRIVILPELWLGPDEDLRGRYPGLMEWLRLAHKRGAYLYSACSGAIMLAETGLLDGCAATSHWAYRDLFETRYPNVRFLPEPNLVVGDRSGRIVTAGGTTSWHDLAIHIISRHVNPGEALRIAKIYLLKWHDEGQLPYTPLVHSAPHADSVVRECQRLLAECYREADAIQRVVQRARIPERTLKRRFKAATGSTFIEYVQHLRIEEAKRLLETSTLSADDVSAQVGYEDHSFFRRLFKRLTGLKPREYRRLFQSVMTEPGVPPAARAARS
jgi:transcriptional regulator GlxA family with amidase domain